MGAEMPSIRPDILILESTYGVQRHSNVRDREKRFTEFVHSVVKRGGRCLIPVFALGALARSFVRSLFFSFFVCSVVSLIN